MYKMHFILNIELTNLHNKKESDFLIVIITADFHFPHA